jgi:pectin methylesterase-like acyl-CoA thioesterase
MSARSYPSRLFAVSALLLAALAAVTSPGPASGRSWLVLLDGSGDAPTIQAAVDSAAAEGDSILVGSGAYYQAVLINNKSLVMRSLEGRD